ncbi:hypothetical protein BDN72DRAFT_887603 [Pluteus cervinus]|uniref:Uncharacterized protein n=1 Tax=Pluteus cervinus TaxID=181527 RepID=A0ACD3B0P4_9AGAR|nr:hypothetical protein BDN72DRAFT_887603 [Pluteus cervinus]
MLPPRAYTFIFLNAVRVLSIIALLLVFSSNIVTLAHDVEAVNRFMAADKVSTGSTNATMTAYLDADYIADSTVPNQAAGVFWAVLNRLLIIGQTVVLLLSEFGWPSAFFNRFFPVLGDDFGLGAFGVMQCLIGAAILSHHVDTFTLVSAFFLFSLGCLNILLGLIWRQHAKSKRSITSWKEQAKSVLPTHVAGVDVSQAPPYVSKAFSAGVEKLNTGSTMSSLGFGRQGEKAAAKQGFNITTPSLVRSKYMPSSAPPA